jgi:hypothetical protein
VFYSPVCSSVAFKVFFFVLTHAREVFLKVRLAEEDTWAKWAFVVFCLDMFRQLTSILF